jgi:ADP-heptose:LPS heptosyltransferase
MAYHNDYPVQARGIAIKKKTTYLKNEHIVTRALKTVEALGIVRSHKPYHLEACPEDRQYILDVLVRHCGMDETKKFIVISPGAVWEGRTWSLEKWKKLMRLLADKDDLRFVVIGSSEERARHGCLCDGFQVFNLSGQLNLAQLAALIERCFLFIGVDSGAMHLSAAMGKPLIALFGPNIPEVCGPKGGLSIVVQEDMRCRPCNQDTCPVSKGRRCMDLIRPEDVLRAYDDLVARCRRANTAKHLC